MRRCYKCGAKMETDYIVCPECEQEIERRRGKMGGMYIVNIYQDFPHGDFKLLETYYAHARDREDAKLIALRYAQEKYKDRKVSVTNVN